MSQDWGKFLAPHYGQKRRIAWERGTGAGHRTVEFEAYVFDAARETDAVEDLFQSIIGDWDVVEDAIGKGEDDLVMFATENDTGEDDEDEDDEDEDEDEGDEEAGAGGDPFAMVEVILFYDKATGEVYLYEEGGFDRASAGKDKPVYRLDQITIEAV